MPITGKVDTTHKLNVSLLSTQLAKEAWWSTFWAKLAGFQEITNLNGIRQTNPASNVVLQVVRDFVQEGRDNMLMAMIEPLKEDPIYGDTWLKGTGETVGLKYQRIYINQVRKAVTKLAGHMSNQRLKSFKLMEKAMPSLVEYWSKWQNAALFETMYLGLSPQLTAGKSYDGVGMKARLHPNQYIYNASSVFAPIGSEFHTKTAAEMSAGIKLAAKPVDADFLYQLNILVKTNLLIEPIVTEDGTPFWFLLVHPQSMRNFKKDNTIMSVQNSAFAQQLGKHPAIKGRDYLYFDGFVMVEERTGTRTLKLAGVTDVYAELAGANGWMKPPAFVKGTDSTSMLLLGRDALGLGIAQNLLYTEEVDDHENVIEIGSRMIQGANRNEYFGAKDEKEIYAVGSEERAVLDTAYKASNQGSAIVWTKE